MALTGLVRRKPLACYFALVYLVSGVALVVLGLPKLDGAGGRQMLSLVMFPVMVAGVGLVGVALTAMTGGARACVGCAPGSAARSGGGGWLFCSSPRRGSWPCSAACR